MKQFKINKSILLLFCYYIYPFILQKAFVLSYIVLYGIPIIYLLLNFHLLKKLFQYISIKTFFCMFFMMLIIVLSYIEPVLHGTNDFSYIKTATIILRRLILYIFLVTVLFKKYKKNMSIEHFIYYFCFATIIYVLTTLCFTAIPSLKNYWMNIVSSEQHTDLLSQSFGYSMRIGWMGFSGFRVTFHCTLSVCFLMYFLFAVKNNLFFTKKSLIVFLIISLLGNAFYGRIGILASAMIILISLIYYRVLDIGKIVEISFILLIGLIIIFGLSNINSNLYDWYIWMSTPFKNLLTTGSFNNASANELLNNMIFLPDYKTILFGDGWYNNPSGIGYYMSTDSGFMRQILFWGLPGVIITYGCLIILLTQFKSNYRFLGYLIFLSFVIFEIKGEVYFEYLPLLLVFAQISIWKKRQQK